MSSQESEKHKKRLNPKGRRPPFIPLVFPSLSHPPKCTPSKLAFKRRFSSSARQQFHQPPAHHPPGGLHFDTLPPPSQKCKDPMRVSGLWFVVVPYIWDSQGRTATPVPHPQDASCNQNRPSPPVLQLQCTRHEAIVLPSPQPLHISQRQRPAPNFLAFGPDPPLPPVSPPRVSLQL